MVGEIVQLVHLKVLNSEHRLNLIMISSIKLKLSSKAGDSCAYLGSWAPGSPDWEEVSFQA